MALKFAGKKKNNKLRSGTDFPFAFQFATQLFLSFSRGCGRGGRGEREWKSDKIEKNYSRRPSKVS